MTQLAGKAVAMAAEATMSEFEKLMAGAFKPKQAEQIDNLAAIAVDYLSKAGQTVKAALARGTAAKELKKLIAEPAVWASIMELKGKASGFATDERPATEFKDEVRYTDSVLQDAIVDAMLDGAQLSDCEINIISKRKYLGVSFYRRKLREVASDIIWSPGVPTVMTTTKPGWKGKIEDLSVWKVPAILKFRPNRDGAVGEPIVFDHSGASHDTPCVAVQYRGSSDTIDGAMGKAERKLRKRAYETCIGRFTEDEPDDAPASETPASTLIVSKTVSDKITEAEKAAPGMTKMLDAQDAQPETPAAAPAPAETPSLPAPTPEAPKWPTIEEFVEECMVAAEITADEVGYRSPDLEQKIEAAVKKCLASKRWKDNAANRKAVVDAIRGMSGNFAGFFTPPADTAEIAETATPAADQPPVADQAIAPSDAIVDFASFKRMAENIAMAAGKPFDIAGKSTRRVAMICKIIGKEETAEARSEENLARYAKALDAMGNGMWNWETPPMSL